MMRSHCQTHDFNGHCWCITAFYYFFFREDAQNAIDQVNGHGYDHLILQVDWAEDRKPAEGGK